MLDEIRVGLSWADVTPAGAVCNSAFISTQPTDTTVVEGLAAQFTTVAGGIWAYHRNFVSVEAFTFFTTIEYIAMIIIGGMGSVLGAILGAYILSSAEDYIHYIKPLVAVYTLILGLVIIRKAIQKIKKKRRIRKMGLLAVTGGFLDSVGGGGWGPIVSSSLIASGRHPMYTIGSVNLTEFFVSFASSVTFITLIGLDHWQVVLGLVLGGMVAAPVAALIARRLPVKTMMILVGLIVVIVSLRNIYASLF